jgi:uncharacterized protein with ParB-like and HNH nuclease domain/predicted transport protein
MNAQDIRLIDLLDGKKQFIVPVFQRDYSWGTKHCLQLWDDVLRAGIDATVSTHFVGSIVYIAAEETSANVGRWLLIDGQQRVTTLTLLLIAVRNALSGSAFKAKIEAGDLPSADDIQESYLINRHAKDDRRYKLHLRRSDYQTLAAIIDDPKKLTGTSQHVLENVEFFSSRLDENNLDTVFKGINKLKAVDVHLHRGQDDPQMIFESLNSTGLDLTQADLIRNFVLMRQEEGAQTELYTNYWQPMEIDFGSQYRSEYDKFVRDFLILELKPSRPLKSEIIYQSFRTYFHDQSSQLGVAEILAKLRRFSEYFVRFNFGLEPDAILKESFSRLRSLIEVASPVIMRLYDCFDRVKSLSHDEFVEAVDLLESYVFRRSACGMQTRSLGQIFASLALRVKEDTPLLSLKTALYLQAKMRRFPSSGEFADALQSRDVYDMRTCFYLLDRLENDSKEKIDTSSFSIEHVLPQNEDLNKEWQVMLGPTWQEIQAKWLHKLGNLTLTGYNSKYSDKSFQEKKTIDKGFNDSPLRLNKFVREQGEWTEPQIERRGKQLAEAAVSIWPPLIVPESAIKAAQLEELRVAASRYSLDTLALSDGNRALFLDIQEKLMGLGDDVTELFTAKTVVYRVYDFFLEIIPRRHGLALYINLDFEECVNPPSGTRDISDYAFVPGATERSGVVFDYSQSDQLEAAMGLIKQSYESVAE